MSNYRIPKYQGCKNFPGNHKPLQNSRRRRDDIKYAPYWGPINTKYLLHGAESFFEKLTGFQLVKKFPSFYGTRRFITAFTCEHHLSLSWAMIRFTVRSCKHLVQPPSWRTTPCRLPATAYSIYSQLPSMLEAFPPSATWRRLMPWWQGPTYNGILSTMVHNLIIWATKHPGFVHHFSRDLSAFLQVLVELLV